MSFPERFLLPARLAGNTGSGHGLAVPLVGDRSIFVTVHFWVFGKANEPWKRPRSRASTQTWRPWIGIISWPEQIAWRYWAFGKCGSAAATGNSNRCATIRRAMMYA